MPPNKLQLKIEAMGHRWIGRIHPMWGARREEKQWPPATDREPVIRSRRTGSTYFPASRVRDAYSDFTDYLRGATEVIWIQRAIIVALAALLWWRW